MTRRLFFALLGVPRVFQAAPPADVVAVNRLQHAYTLLQSETVDGAAAGLLTAPALSLITNWYQQASSLLYTDGVTQQIDTVITDVLSQLIDRDRAYLQPYAALIVALRKATL